MKDPYKIKIDDNGNISINVFENGNPIPYISFKGKINDKKTKDFLNKVKYKFANEDAFHILDYLSRTKSYDESMSEEMNYLSSKFDFN